MTGGQKPISLAVVDPAAAARACRDNAARCRRLARQTTDGQIAERLLILASEYEEHAVNVEKPEG